MFNQDFSPRKGMSFGTSCLVARNLKQAVQVLGKTNGHYCIWQDGCFAEDRQISSDQNKPFKTFKDIVFLMENASMGLNLKCRENGLRTVCECESKVMQISNEILSLTPLQVHKCPRNVQARSTAQM